MQIDELIEKQRAFFDTGKTLDAAFRIQALVRLEESILKHEKELEEALHKDLGKSGIESYMCETGLSLSEIRYIRRHVRSWSRDRRVRTPLAQFVSSSFTVQEPYGIA